MLLLAAGPFYVLHLVGWTKVINDVPTLLFLKPRRGTPNTGEKGQEGTQEKKNPFEWGKRPKLLHCIINQ